MDTVDIKTITVKYVGPQTWATALIDARGKLIVRRIFEMTAKEILGAPVYGSTSKCPKCGSRETEDEYQAGGSPYYGVPPFARFISRICGDCGYSRLEKPKDWTDDEQVRLERWCTLLGLRDGCDRDMRILLAGAPYA